jgi:ABC-type phosphate transport system permease subunit
MKQLTVHIDAMVIVALVFLASLGMNAWQFLNNRELMQKYVDSEWELGNTRANVVYTRRLLKACNPDKHEDLDARP